MKKLLLFTLVGLFLFAAGCAKTASDGGVTDAGTTDTGATEELDTTGE